MNPLAPRAWLTRTASPSRVSLSRFVVRPSGLSVTVLMALGALGLVSACSQGEAQGGHGAGAGGPPPAAVSTQKVEVGSVSLAYEFVGQTAGAREVEVRARVPGILLQRNFKEGSTVKAGQSLYTVDPASFQAGLNKAVAAVASAQARVAQAVRNEARLKPLWEAKAISQRDYDDAVSALQIAQADLKSTEADRAEAALNLAYTKVAAPIAGVVGRSLPSEGTLVAGPETLLTTITQTDPIKLRFGVSDTDQMRWRDEVAAGRLSLPADNAFEVEVQMADGRVYAHKGHLLFSDARVSSHTGTIEAEAEVPNPEGVLKPGQFVRLKLLGATQAQAIQVPVRAVLEGPQGKFVYVAAEGKAMPRPVTVGAQLPGGWVIQDGLKAGDEVIVDGTARIFFPGAPIVQGPAPGGAAASGAAASSPTPVLSEPASAAASR